LNFITALPTPFDPRLNLLSDSLNSSKQFITDIRSCITMDLQEHLPI